MNNSVVGLESKLECLCGIDNQDITQYFCIIRISITTTIIRLRMIISTYKDTFS